METFDYIIVGAGPAGCVLANRLSADPATSVALIDAGPSDRHPLVTMPKGFGRLLAGSRFVTRYRTEADAGGREHVWGRGTTLGGSTSINGMCYSRGQPEDYDNWAAMGASGWGWSEMLRAFRSIEDHELGDDGVRGTGGPLAVGINRHPNRPNEAALDAARTLGIPIREDINRPDQIGIGPMPHMIRHGRRVSAARAFLDPARHRSNLTVLVQTRARRILFDGRRASGVEVERDGNVSTLRARREVILSAGAFESPKLLMLSGIGPAAQLTALGIDVRHDSPGVGENLAEHRGMPLQFELREKLSHNPHFSGPRLMFHGLRYYLLRSGLLSYGTYEVMGFAKTLPDSTNADSQLLISPFSRILGVPITFEKLPGMQCLIFAGRPSSRGAVRLRSADPRDPPLIAPPEFDTDQDRVHTLAMVRFARRLFDTEPLASMIARETFPGPHVTSDADILESFYKDGVWINHTCGTARMGTDEAAVVDERLRVRGVEGLRVVDASVFPAEVTANTTAPVAAVAWRAADLVLEDQPRP